MATDTKVGATFTYEQTCDPYRPLYYAAASGDFNPIHIDPAAGEKAGLGGAILQGLCTYAWAADAAARHLGDPGMIRRIQARFSKPVLPGDTIRYEGTVTSVEANRWKAEISAKNQKGEDVLKAASVEADLSSQNR